jgi:transcriptional regulator with XRE-family HTH domain
MPYPARELDPSASPRALFGFQLRQLRERKHLTQAALGGTLFVSEDAVATWEKGRSLPGHDAARQLDDDLDGRGLLLAAWRLAAANHQADSEADNQADSSADAFKQGRQPAIIGASVADRPVDALFTAAQEAADFASWAERLNAGGVAITSLTIRARELARACLTMPPAEMAGHAAALNREAFALLKGHHKPAHARDLYAIAAQTCALLAWLSGDLGALDAATLQGSAAQVCADHADQPEVTAWVAVVRSKTAFWCGDYLGAARLARQGAACSPPGTAAIMLACQEADAYSKLGAVDLARQALQRAEDAAESVRGADTIGGLFSCAPARHANYSSGAHLAIGQLDLALAEAERALAECEIDPAYGFGTVGQIHLTRALAFTANGDLDGAAEAARPVLDLAPERRLATLKDRLRPMATALGRNAVQKNVTAGALRAEITEFCGVASLQRQLMPGSTEREEHR